MCPPPLQLLTTALLVLALAASAFARPKRADFNADAPPVVLKPFEVKGEPITCFGLALALVVDPQTRRIDRLFVLKVTPDSEASIKGLKAGTEILAADNREIRALAAQFDPGSEFNHLFMNRRAGSRLTLRIVSAKGDRPREIQLTQGARSQDSRPWLPDEFP